MGCIKKLLASVELKDCPASPLHMELNETGSSHDHIVHIQTPLWRMELTRAEFKAFASAVTEAGRRLRDLKGPPSEPRT